jgi:hypothetical protein
MATPPPYVQTSRAGSTPRFGSVVEERFVFVEQKTAPTSLVQMISSAKTQESDERVRSITWGGEEVYECEYPDSHLWVRMCRRRGAISLDHPAKRATRLEKDLGAILALVYADT